MLRSYFSRPLLLFSLVTLPLTTALAQTAAADAAAPATAAPSPAGAALERCAHPFGLSDDDELVYQQLDANGKVTGLIRNRVVRLAAETTKKKTVVTNTVLIKSGFYDKKNHLVRTQDLTYLCRQDTSFTDGLAEVDYDNLRAFRDRRYAFTPVPLAWPNQPTAGTRLPSGGATTQVSSSAVDLAKVYTTIQKRRVVGGPGPVTTPAGTFSCYQVESERESATAARADLVLRTINRVVDYYSPSVGIVKTEVYGKSGKLEQSRVLAERNVGGGGKVRIKTEEKSR